MDRPDPRYHCPRCATAVPVEGPTGADRARFAVTTLVIAGVLFGAPFLGFALIFAAPVLMVVGIGLGGAVGAAFAPVCCARCGCEVRRTDVVAATVPSVARAALP